ncbi:Uncharacterised protein [Bordetella pertussis]|nr:Uncharacterised protein [Bordetella pertussis]
MPKASAWRRSARHCSSSWPGKANIRSRLTRSTVCCAMAMAARAWAASWMRPSLDSWASSKLWMPSDSRVTPLAA